jgi:transcriptional regulator with XRE-family HTH domain
MAEFTRKILNNELCLGAKLKAARELKQLDLKTVAKRLDIRLDYLIAIESSRFDHLPAGLYGKNYIKKYASLLKFPKSEVRKWLNSNLEVVNESSDPFSQKIVRRQEFVVFPKLIKNIILILVFIACLFYLSYYFKKIIFPPELVIYQPDKNLKVTGSSIVIQGLTEPEAELSINGEAILNTSHGHFNTTVNLKKGVNNIVISAKKKYSQEATVLRQILVE